MRRFTAGGGVAKLQVQLLSTKKRPQEGFMVAGYVSHTREDTTPGYFT